MTRVDRVAAIFFALLCLLALSMAAPAQGPIDATPCQRACYEQKAACVEACGQHRNPMECESECHEQRDDCLRSC